VANAAAFAAPHLLAFAQFDRWARRAGVSEAVMQNRAALGEAMFAPIRGASDVAAAWVQIEREHGFVLSLPADAPPPPSANWVPLRDPRLGALRTARLPRCNEALGTMARTGFGVACVLISRSEVAPSAGAVVVTVAFREATAGAAPGAAKR
jgi:hypothetical protein